MSVKELIGKAAGERRQAPVHGAGESANPFATAPSPFLNGQLREEYDGAAMLYELHGVFPLLYQGLVFKQWQADPDQNGAEPARDFWRQMGRNAIQERLDFVRDANAEIGDWYNRTINFAIAILDGILSAQEVVVRELLSWGDSIPATVGKQATNYLASWARVGREAQDAIRKANEALQRQLGINDGLLSEATRFADTLGENYEAEVQTLRTRVRELEAEVLRLLDENIKLRERIAQLEAEARKFGLRLPSAQEWKTIALVGGGIVAGVTTLGVLLRILLR